MPSPAAASVIASTVYLYPYGLQEREAAFPALAMVIVPAFLMVSTIRFRSVKAIDVGHTRSYFPLILAILAIAIVATHPRIALVVLSYTYTAAALIMWGYSKLRRRPTEQAPKTIQFQIRAGIRTSDVSRCRADTYHGLRRRIEDPKVR